ncbi:Ribosomal protein S18 acetylase RimI [Tenacibaculum sp. MAR_2009_124]|uniref:GNAT family N-acetyltransferase n=1 Tax=Tenacibaculum sp. MAR_2009_124 TaxID=1250059 RepID=UPI00089D0D61|nr:GNAT family N-acetyltransferase [Tenacibaculum sp. MAR_2009_124]SED04822.1 Ribosomal protein S18 acetylase RimI [Tenacibaculum sp. MAR_2009_124]
MLEVINLIRTNSVNGDFKILVGELDRYLSGVNGDDDDFFRGHNKIDHLNHVIIAYSEGGAVGCGAFKVTMNKGVEIKRMYIRSEFRGNKIAVRILEELEKWARNEGFEHVVLETSKEMRSAIQLYRKKDYEVIPNYEPYTNMKSSICFKKIL